MTGESRAIAQERSAVKLTVAAATLEAMADETRRVAALAAHGDPQVPRLARRLERMIAAVQADYGRTIRHYRPRRGGG